MNPMQNLRLHTRCTLGSVVLFTILCTQLRASDPSQQSAAAAQTASRDQLASKEINGQVRSGNKQALRKLSALDLASAVPLLSIYARDKDTDAELAAIAIDTLRQMPGLRAYFSKHIAELHKGQNASFNTLEEFRTLELIRTKDAVAAAAPFLFSEDPPDPIEGDCAYSPLSDQALFALMKMNLPDAPTHKPFYAANDEDMKKWRDWWTAHKGEYE